MKIRQSRRYGSFSELAALRVYFRYDLKECVYQISGLYRFQFGQEVPYRQNYRQTDIFTSENKSILDRLLASRGFLIDMVWGSVETNFQVCIIFRSVRRRIQHTHTQEKMQANIGILATGYSPHVNLKTYMCQKMIKTTKLGFEPITLGLSEQ